MRPSRDSFECEQQLRTSHGSNMFQWFPVTWLRILFSLLSCTTILIDTWGPLIYQHLLFPHRTAACQQDWQWLSKDSIPRCQERDCKFWHEGYQNIKAPVQLFHSVCLSFSAAEHLCVSSNYGVVVFCWLIRRFKALSETGLVNATVFLNLFRSPFHRKTPSQLTSFN